MSDSPQKVIVHDLGRADYESSWRLQSRLHEQLVAAKRAGRSESQPHIILTVEHPPVFTLGKSGRAENLLVTREELVERGVTYYEIDRGGDITFHGPGQQVVYLILDLDRFYTDIHRYLRELEEAVIRTCREFGVEGTRIKGKTGVWIAADEHRPVRKICAMGIRCSRWVTMHGIAMNINTDLDYFSMIVPCGVTDGGVTSLAREVGKDIDMGHVRGRLLHHITDLMGMDLEHSQQAASGEMSIEQLTASIFTGA